ncbi:hypothetical protein UlMin_019268 [Ulmus minor]
MKLWKAVELDVIPIEAWKCLGEVGIQWLTRLFNKILKTRKMADSWRHNIVVPIYKNKGDILDCLNYRGIKLMSHTMKLWERVIEQRLRSLTIISENQFDKAYDRIPMELIWWVLRRGNFLNIMLISLTICKKGLQQVFAQ